MATHSSILAWRIPWTEKPGGLQSTGPQRVRHNWGDWAFMHVIFIVQIVIATICVFGIILNALCVTFYLPNIPTGNSYSSHFTDEKLKFSERLHFEGMVAVWKCSHFTSKPVFSSTAPNPPVDRKMPGSTFLLPTTPSCNSQNFTVYSLQAQNRVGNHVHLVPVTCCRNQ